MRLLALMSLTLALAAAACGKPSGSSAGGSSDAPPPSSQSSPSKDVPIDPATVGTITGVVKLDGWLKPDGPINMGGVAYCAAQHPDGITFDTLILGEGQAMANVYVTVKSGLGNRRFPAPATPAVLDQVGCIYTPHVVVVRANQPLVVRNSDNIMHNVHSYPQLSTGFNDGQGVKGQENTYKLPNPELAVSVRCDVHTWMSAWIHVCDHPFFSVTGKDGVYKIEGLPPGDYELQAWHERFAKEPLMVQVKLPPKGKVDQPFTFKGGKKPTK